MFGMVVVCLCVMWYGGVCVWWCVWWCGGDGVCAMVCGGV